MLRDPLNTAEESGESVAAAPPEEDFEGDYIPPELRTAPDVELDEEMTAPAAPPRKAGPILLPPYAMSVFIAGAGLLLSFAALVIPSLRHLPLPLGLRIFTPFPVLVLPLLAIIWAIIGMLPGKNRRHVEWCFVGLGLAVIGLICVAMAIWLDPSSG